MMEEVFQWKKLMDSVKLHRIPADLEHHCLRSKYKRGRERRKRKHEERPKKQRNPLHLLDSIVLIRQGYPPQIFPLLQDEKMVLMVETL
jgi:hypothetical protein